MKIRPPSNDDGHKTAYKGEEQDVIDAYAQQTFEQIPGAPTLDGSRAVDGQKAFKIFRPLPRKSEGKSLELRKKVVGIYDKGKAGTVIETTTSLVDKATGQPYTTETGSVFFVGQGGWGGPKGQRNEIILPQRSLQQPAMADFVLSMTGPKPTVYAPPKDRKPDRVHTIQTGKEAALLYR